MKQKGSKQVSAVKRITAKTPSPLSPADQEALELMRAIAQETRKMPVNPIPFQDRSNRYLAPQ